MPDNRDVLAYRRPKGLRLVGVVLLAIAFMTATAGLAVRWVESRKTVQWTEEQAVPAVHLIALKGATGGDFTLPGDIQAFTTAGINAQVSGTIQKWFVDIGTPVRQGQVLAQIDPRPYEAALASARGQLAKDSATLANSQLDLNRYRTLAAQNAISAQQLATQQANVAAQTAIVETDRATVRTAEINLGFTRVVAPVSGIVTTRNIDVGQLVTANAAGAAPMFTVTDQDRLRIYVRMPQNYSFLVRPGMTASFTVPEYPGRIFTATLAANAGAIASQSGTQLLQMQVDNEDHLLKPGAYAEMRFSMPKGGAGVRVPVTALLFRDNGMQVAIVGGDGKVVLKPIRITTDLGTVVEVGAGLKPGDKVIDNPPDGLQAGDTVRVTGDG
ncbi:MAG: efflux RND transporter periplasmic adaptor subunit [Alphaproteobacteria bacterium]|nr:efflux RND transporter periplasmic adaptor subunit [Alphaproteobacteria bacterium]